MSKKINRKYKDRLFKKVFEKREDLLSLYNAVNGTDYNNVEDITVNTIEECVYMSMKNDVPFLRQLMIVLRTEYWQTYWLSTKRR